MQNDWRQWRNDDDLNEESTAYISIIPSSFTNVYIIARSPFHSCLTSILSSNPESFEAVQTSDSPALPADLRQGLVVQPQ
jgi:CII-binding regulator of phage lambda lysogenization HflD